MRLAVVSTPRCGNTWVRILVSFLFQVPHVSFDHPDDVDWSRLPESCALQIHWYRTPAFQRLLDEHGFKIATLARHPLDVFVSILQFVRHDVAHWLERASPAERAIVGETPTSAPFLAYATSARAARLLGITADWWENAHVHRIHYEDLVADPVAGAHKLCDFLDAEPVVDVEHAVEATRIEKLRPLVSNNHFWRGSPGLWRQLVTADVAWPIARAHQQRFRLLAYACDSDEALTESNAEANWRRAVGTASR
jgi:hypothetical protein